MRLLPLVSCGKVRVSGQVPAALLPQATGVVLRIGRRTVAGELRSDGHYKITLHSRKSLLWVTVWVCLAGHEQARIDRRLVINRRPAERAGILEQFSEFSELRQFLDIEPQHLGHVVPVDSKSLLIHWIIPDFRAGAGGHQCIFRMAHLLKARGHRNEFWIIGDCAHANPADYIDRHFFSLGSPAHRLAPTDVNRIHGDVVVATSCWSAYYARGIRHVGRKCYLVQDYEPWFYPMGVDFQLARQTYHFGFDMIVAGRWLAVMLAREGVRASACFSFAYDPRHYYCLPDRIETEPSGTMLRVAFYARIATERRMVPLGLRALDLLARRRSDFTVHFFGQQTGPGEVAYRHIDEGVLDEAALGRLYRACDLGIVFSATNHSIVPVEMMACGLPVLELAGENNELIYPEGCIAFASPEPQAIADAIGRLLDSPRERAELRRRGFDHATTLSWDHAADIIESALIGNQARPASAPVVSVSPA